MSIVKKMKRLIKTRIFVNEEIILFKHENELKCSSSAKIVKASKDNINDVLDFQDIQYLRKFERFLGSGDVGYLGYLDDRCVHRSWVKQGPQQVKLHPIYKYILAEGDIFIHYCETAEKARGNRIYPHVLSIIARNFKNKRILISSERTNRSSIMGITRAGFEEFKRFRVRAILGIQLTTEKSPNK